MLSEVGGWSAWRASAAEPAIDAAIRALYARLDADIAARGPTCWQSGKCCNFGSYGHRLYVTALEVAWFLRGVEHAADARDTVPGTLPGGGEKGIALPQMRREEVCAFQVDRSCSTHAIRPLGCRIFFCQSGTEAWQQALYEGYLDELRGLHDLHGVAYRYADWMALLDEAQRA